ncbi:MAG: family 20 glycosylhydrolase, partial [Prevotella sp.]
MKKNILLLLLLAASLCLPAFAINKKPFTIPEVKEWKGADGTLALSGRIVCNGAEERRIAQQLADDYRQMFGTALTLAQGKAQKGDIVLSLKAPKTLGEEGYTMSINAQATIAAANRKGLYWGTRTLLQLAEQSQTRALPCGFISDAPDYPFRGFMLDCGRKFFSMPMLRQYVRMMAYYKMNVFHIHLNDNAFHWFYNGDWSRTPAAFRMESNRFPGLTARDGHYTKKDFIALQELADSVGVEILPEIDVPAHCLALTRFRPDLVSKDYPPDHLDLLNPNTQAFCDSLFTEYLEGKNPVFRGKYVHVGT